MFSQVWVIYFNRGKGCSGGGSVEGVWFREWCGIDGVLPGCVFTQGVFAQSVGAGGICLVGVCG